MSAVKITICESLDDRMLVEEISRVLDDYEKIEATSISERNQFSSLHSKILVIAITSFYDDQITNKIKESYGSRVPPNLFHFVCNKAIERKFSNLFAWGEDGEKFIKQFLGNFGKDFSSEVMADLKKNTKRYKEITDGASAFSWIGDERNKVCRANFIKYSIDTTLVDVAEKYSKSREFVLLVINGLFPPPGA